MIQNHTFTTNPTKRSHHLKGEQMPAKGIAYRIAISLFILCACNSKPKALEVDLKKASEKTVQAEKIGDAETIVLRSSVNELQNTALKAQILDQPNIEKNGNSYRITIPVQITWNPAWISKLKERLDLIGTKIDNNQSIHDLNKKARTTGRTGYWNNGTYINGDDSSKAIIAFSNCKETHFCINWASRPDSFNMVYDYFDNINNIKSIHPISWAVPLDAYKKSRMDLASAILSYDIGKNRGNDHYITPGYVFDGGCVIYVSLLGGDKREIGRKEINVDPHLAISGVSNTGISDGLVIILPDASPIINISFNVDNDDLAKIKNIEVKAGIKPQAIAPPVRQEQG